MIDIEGCYMSLFDPKNYYDYEVFPVAYVLECRMSETGDLILTLMANDPWGSCFFILPNQERRELELESFRPGFVVPLRGAVGQGGVTLRRIERAWNGAAPCELTGGFVYGADDVRGACARRATYSLSNVTVAPLVMTLDQEKEERTISPDSPFGETTLETKVWYPCHLQSDDKKCSALGVFMIESWTSESEAMGQVKYVFGDQWRVGDSEFAMRRNGREFGRIRLV